MRRVVAVAITILACFTIAFAYPGFRHGHRNLLREYCDTNTKSEACKKIKRLMEQIREARRELIAEMKGYCDANPEKDFCNRLKKMHRKSR